MTDKSALILDTPVLDELDDKHEHSAHEYIQNLSLIIFPYNAQERVMANFAAYFDESGTHDSPILALACYIATVEQWAHFLREWDEILKQESLTHFHMSKFEARRGEFAGWDNERRLRVQKRLISIIKRRVNVGIFCAVNLAAYDEFITEWRREGFGSPYNFCVKLCLSLISFWAQKYERKEPIAFVIEHGAGYNGELTASFNGIFANEQMRQYLRLGSLTFVDKKMALPLQAADLLAYEVWKDSSNKFLADADKKRPERKSFRSLREIIHQGTYWGRDEFQQERERENTNFEIRTPDAIFTFRNQLEKDGVDIVIEPSFKIKFD
jgi:hypothetical protein